MGNATMRDFMVGIFVLVGLGAVAWLSLRVGGVETVGRGGIALYAKFDNVADLRARAPVEMAGVKVGQVTGIALDDDYRARVDFILSPSVKLPVDSSAAVVTAGLLGDRYLSLEPGAEEDFLKEGEQVAYTESALVLERMVGKFLVNVEDEEK